MFHWDRGLWLTRAQLAIDVPRRQACGFISHAHSDHVGRHELALCTPATARLYQHRYGTRHVYPMHYGRPLEWGGMQLTALPAGHCLGSAMLLAEEDGRSLLYTGDYKLSPSATAEPIQLPRADVLITESTFGDPKYRFPPRDQVIGQLLAIVREALAREVPPVIEAYEMGKSQEVTRILTDHGIGVLQHPRIFAVSQIYEACGMPLGAFGQYDGVWREGHAVITLPPRQKAARLTGLDRRVRIAVTGWAMDPSTTYRRRVDHALPLSDHADYDELLETIERVEPRAIYVTHGPDGFADHLRDLGHNAFPLGRSYQARLF